MDLLRKTCTKISLWLTVLTPVWHIVRATLLRRIQREKWTSALRRCLLYQNKPRWIVLFCQLCRNSSKHCCRVCFMFCWCLLFLEKVKVLCNNTTDRSYTLKSRYIFHLILSDHSLLLSTLSKSPTEEFHNRGDKNWYLDLTRISFNTLIIPYSKEPAIVTFQVP